MNLRRILSTLCLTLLTALAAPATANAQSTFTLKEVEGEHQLLWGEQIVLRRLTLKLHGQAVDFDPDLLDLQFDGKNCSIGRKGGGVGGSMQLGAIFALSYKPVVRRSQAMENGVIQFVSGKTAGRKCDTILAPETGLGIQISGFTLDLAAYEAGAPLSIRFHLDSSPTLTLVDAPAADENQNELAGLESELRRRFAEEDGTLPKTLQQLLKQPKNKKRSFHLLNRAQQQPSAETQIINFRIAEGASFPAQDVILFLNGSDQKRKLTANFQDMGWDKVKMRRLAVQYPDGDCLGEVRNSLSVTVPAQGWSVVLLRKTMPRGIIATSDGPFFALGRNWAWSGSGTAKSGSRSFFAAYDGPGTTTEGGWMILSTSNGAKAPYTLEKFTDPDGNRLKHWYTAGDSWARVEYPVNESESQTVHFHFGGAGPGGASKGKK
jgi:hypothetical protein